MTNPNNAPDLSIVIKNIFEKYNLKLKKHIDHSTGDHIYEIWQGKHCLNNNLNPHTCTFSDFTKTIGQVLLRK
jgi:hypothetical protein